MKNTTPATQGRRHVSAAVFRDKSLSFLAEVARTGREIVVTRHGRPVAVISPAVRRPGNTFVGSGKNLLTIESSLDALDTQADQPSLPPVITPLLQPGDDFQVEV